MRSIGGERNAPPEHSDGVPGFEYLLATLAGASAPDVVQLLVLVDSQDPEVLDEDAIRAGMPD